ncbi:hypothetical protein [Streptomyces sp. NPDC095613]|uniref:hypothetical protein n=1 Tax=Streptomyces sp. NPDC095613 TaxID=3155540 RepID=UPI003328551F
MSRRVSLPGADELFRTTGGTALQSSTPVDRRRNAGGEPRVPAPTGAGDEAGADQAAEPAEEEHGPAAEPEPGEPSRNRGTAGGTGAAGGTAGTAAPDQAAAAMKGRRPSRDASGTSAGAGGAAAAAGAQGGQQRRRGRGANRRPSGRERHDEKITVYVSAEELMDLEHARLVLRGEHGLAVDRGRIVREAVAVVLADLESRGDASILVRRLRGR